GSCVAENVDCGNSLDIGDYGLLDSLRISLSAAGRRRTRHPCNGPAPRCLEQSLETDRICHAHGLWIFAYRAPLEFKRRGRRQGISDRQDNPRQPRQNNRSRWLQHIAGRLQRRETSKRKLDSFYNRKELTAEA